ncbi:hypothetical protein [Cellulomonas dongxiuzhuiae]|uniref:ApeA N-terminal domain-containing protein n=1 Tax=Cellulomonas dongxiuzhuiae TaxID=2819979 RepID=A0ABX8GL11_9CELL|nr:hypothetical protein [Cellulomonas dongxiuzhuiae]MBO3095556.1 hypothetical protein [Cellulomonas dongxiuzhuiae]QWC16528.1 hypothetical protein KKR89_02325 [Cellulomonas dongxiuzhuiae]
MSGSARVWLRVAGPAIPSTPISIGPFTLQTLDPGTEPAIPPATPDLSGSGSAVVAQFGQEVVGSGYASIEVEGDLNDAILRVIEHDVPLLATALSLQHDEPYRLVPRFAVQGEDLVTAIQTRFIFWDRQDIDADAAAPIHAMYERLVADPRAYSAAHLFSHAVSLHDQAPAPENSAAAVLNYFKVIEIIVGCIEPAEESDADARRAAVVDELTSKLNRGGSPAVSAKAIKGARDELLRIDQKFLDLRIKAAGAAYGLERRAIEQTSALNRFRNQRLGHGGDPPRLSELEKWLDRKSPYSAPSLARLFLLKYVNSLG